jgi:hypothetical protein
MRKFLILALPAVLVAAPAMAQNATGTVIINGSVANKCAVVSGTDSSATWGTTVNLGELSQSDGTLRASGGLSSDFLTSGGTALNAHVVCTTSNPSITVNADPLVNTAVSPASGSGYTNTVHYQADVTVTKVSSSQVYTNDSNAAASGPTALGDRLAANGTNVAIASSNWRTVGTDAQLVSGSYTGQIVVTITP